MHDIVIRDGTIINSTIINGSGKAARQYPP
jgi:hypothetical protein